MDLREVSGFAGAAGGLLGVGEAAGFSGASAAGAEAEPLTSGAGTGSATAGAAGGAEARSLFPLGGAVPPGEGEANVSRPGYVEPADGAAAFVVGVCCSACRSVTTIAVTQAATTDRARVPAIQSRRVPGTREVSGAQPFSHG